MKKIYRDEILAILGLGPDPKHSLLWYKNNFPDLKKIIHDYILNELCIEGIFPLEAKKLNEQQKYIQFPWLIIRKDESNICVLKNDTDHGLILEKNNFSKIDEAIELFIDKSYCTGGAISKYL